MFINDITELLTEKISKLENLIIMGDFNIHAEDHSNMEATIFSDTMQALGPQQYVNKPLHHQVNILNLILTEFNSDLKSLNCKISEYLSDHCLVTIDINMRDKPWWRVTKTICDTSKLMKRISSITSQHQSWMETQTLIMHVINSVMNYEKCLTRLLQKRVKFTNKPIKPWFNKCIRNQRKIVKTRDWILESTGNNIKCKLTQKRETYTITYLSTKRNKSYKTK